MAAGLDDWQSVNDWQDAPEASAPAQAAPAGDWLNVDDWQDAPEVAPIVTAPTQDPAPEPANNLLAQHMAEGTLDQNGRVTPKAEIAAYREGTDWATRNIARPLERGVRNLAQAAAGGQLSKAQRELAALERLDAGEKPDPSHLGEYSLFSMLPPEQRARLKAEKQRAIGVNAGIMVEQGAASAAVPQSPVVKQVENAKGWSEAWDAFSRDPLTYIGNMSLESGPQSAVSMIGALAAARAGGRAGATARIAAGSGVGSGVVEYASALTEAMQQRGVNVQDPAAIQAATNNPALWAEIEKHAETRAAVVGAFDAATMGMASKTIAPKALTGKAAQLVNVPAQAVVQGAGGAAGEAAATVATGGEITPHALMGEFFGEFGTAPVDVATAAFGKAEAADNNPAPRDFITPGEIADARVAEASAYQRQLDQTTIDALNPGNAQYTQGQNPAMPETPAASAPFPPPMEAAGPFVATPEFQEVPPGADMPPGLDIRIDPSTGRSWARIRPTPAEQPQQPAASAVQLDAMLKDPRPAAQVQAEQAAAQQKGALDEETRALAAFGLEKGARVVMEYGSISGPVTVNEAWEENGISWARVSEPDGTTYVVAPGEATFTPIVGDGTSAAPVQATTPIHVDEAAASANPEPTEAQKDAGNYTKGHIKLQGLDIAIENARGSTRSGVGADGLPWSVDMPAHYGYVKRTTGADGENVDVYLGPDHDSGKVYVVDQIDADSGKFDEHKVLIGFTDETAVPTYLNAFNDGRGMSRLGAITTMTMPEFKAWLAKGDTKKPLAWKPAPEVKDWQDVTESAANEGGASSPDRADQQPAQEVVEPAPAAPSPSPDTAEPVPGVDGVTETPIDIDGIHPDYLVSKKGEAIVLYGPDGNAVAVKDDDQAGRNALVNISQNRGFRQADKAVQGATKADLDKLTVPDMTDIQLLAVPDLYGADHKRTKAAAKEMKRRAVAAGSSAHQVTQAKEPAESEQKQAPVDGWAQEVADAFKAGGYSASNAKFKEIAGRENLTLGIQAAFADKAKAAMTAAGWDGSKPTGPSIEVIAVGFDKPKADAEKPVAQSPPLSAAPQNTGAGQRMADRAAAREQEAKDAAKDNAYQRALKLLETTDGLTSVAHLHKNLGIPTGQALTLMQRLKNEGKAKFHREIGTSADGKPLFEDINGVRSYTDGGIRHTETVEVTPRGVVIDTARRGSEYQTAEEVAAATPEVQDQGPATGGIIKVEAQEEPNVRADNVATMDRNGPPALAGAPSEAVRPAEGERDAGPRVDGGGAVDVRRDEGMGGAGGQPRGSVAGDARTVAPSQGRTRAEGGTQSDVPGARSDSRPQQDDAAGLSAPRNYTITEADHLGEGGQTTKYRDNIAAIRLIRQLLDDKRQATAEEQAVLVRYVGWGGIKNAFPDSTGKFLNDEWAKRGAELRGLLTVEEYEAAMRTVLDAHYTSQTVVNGIFQAVKHLGFTHGSILEPSMGTGNFFGLMPASLRGGSYLTGVEFDHITGHIAKQLYPQANILAPMGFQDAPLADGHFDLAIGNPPFGAQGVPGAKDKEIKDFSIHNYFFARTVNKLRPGGVMAMVVTSRYLDKPGERERAYVAHRAEFLGAIRLPNTAFKQNALTSVVTDIVFLKKLAEDKWGTADATWLGTADIGIEGGGTMTVNRYFADNPAMMLGKPALTGSQYQKNEPTLEDDGRDLGEVLAEAVKSLPANVFEAASTSRPTVEMVKQSAEAAPLAADYDIGSYYADGERLMRREESPDGSMVAVELTAATQWTEKTTLGDTRLSRIKGMVSVRDAARALLRLEASDASDAQVAKARAHLNRVYDAFQADHGYLNDRSNEILFKDDPDAPLVLALETGYAPGINAAKARQLGIKSAKPTAGKMAIFSQRVIPRYEPVTSAENPEDALAISLAERGVVDIAHMAALTGKSEDDITRALFDDRDDPLVFKNPATGGWEPAELYLSGNVKAKAIEADGVGLRKNVEALRKVFPPDRKAGDIRIRLGASWVMPQHYAAFAKHLLGNDTKASIIHIPVTGGFTVNITGGSSTNSTSKWGTGSAPAEWLIDRMLNNKEIVIRYKDANGESKVDIERTEAAQAKTGEIRDEFSDWIMRDADRRAELTAFYNDVFNTNVEPKFDGAHLTLPGKVPDSIIKMRRHQRNAIWRGIMTRRCLLDHVVGAGKTFTIVATAMELRRMGLVKKPMIVVPNHLVEQWAQDFYKLYPGAKLLTASKKDFQAKNRKRLLAKIATGDWDAVIIAHSSFGFIPVAKERQIAFMEKQISEVQASIDIMRREEGKDGRRVADLVRSKQNLEKKIKELLDKPKDDLLTFEELGVDQLFLDESQEFKNLFFTTARRGLLGLGNPLGSKKALDMFIKTRYLQETQNGQGVIFATGTPISNSLSEKYTLQRYLGLEELESRGILSFDSWLNNFGNDYSDYELDGTGVKYKQVNRLRGLTNMIEVMAMYRQYADSVTIDQIKQAYAEENPGKKFPIPAVKGGKARENVVIPRSAAQAAYFDEIIERASNIKKGGKDNMLNITTDARKAALDIRLVDPSAGDEPGSKAHTVADRVTEIWRKWEADRGAQLIFLDLSIPLSASKTEGKKLADALEKIEAAAAAVSKASRRGDIAALEEAEAELEALQDKLAKDYSEDDITAVRSAARGFSVYDDLKAKLIDRGIPANEIAFIHDANTDDRKADLFAQVREGRVRVLLGSTSKMGAGTNVQNRLVAEHHVDCPWRPSDIEQREGRIVRQGNELLAKYGDEFEVEILAYATEQTYDARMWQTQEQKLIGIEGLRRYNGDIEMEEVASASASAAEMKAAATGNPLILEDVQLAEAIRKLESQKKAHNRSQYDLEDNQRRYTDLLREGPEKLRKAKADAKTAEAYLADPFGGNPPSGTVDGKTYTGLEDARAAARASYELQTSGAEEGTKPKYSIEINGKECTSQEAVALELTKGWGDAQPFSVTLGKTTFHSRRLAADLLRARGEATGSFGGFAIEIEVTEPSKSGIGDYASDVSVVVTGAGTHHSSRTSYAKKPEDAHRSAAQRAFDLLEQTLEGFAGDVDYVERRMEKAKKELPEIEKELGRPWSKQSELDAKKARHAEVRKALSEKPKPTDPTTPKPPTGGQPTEVSSEAEGGANYRPQTSAAFIESMPGVELDLRAELDKMGLGDIPLDFIHKITMPNGGLADGRYDRGIIALALTAENKPLVMRHEAVHALRSLDLFSKQEWATLERMAESAWIADYKVDEIWKDITPEKRREEAIAEAYAAWRSADVKMGGPVLRAFNKIKRLLGAVGNALRGRGFATWEDVFERVEGGEVGNRPRKEVEEAADTAAQYLIRRPPVPTGPAVLGEDGKLMPDAGILKRLIVHPRTIASIHKAFVPVYRTAEKQFETRDELAAALSRIIEPYMELPAEAKTKVNAVLELGRLQGTVIRTNQLTAVRNAANPEARLSKVGDVIRLNPAEQAGYKAVRDAMDKALELFKRQAIEEGKLDPNTVQTAKDIEALAAIATVPAEQAKLIALADTVRSIEQAKRQGYVPFQRWGQVGIVVKKDAGVDPATGEVIKETVYFEAIEVDGLIERAGRWVDAKLGRPVNFASMPKVVEALNAVKAKYQNLADHDIKLFQIPPKAAMAASAALKLSDMDMLAQVGHLDPQTWDSVRDAFDTAIQARGFRSHFFGSKNIPGYSGDFERVIADYVVGISGYLARRKFNRSWEDSIANIPRNMPKLTKYAQDYRAYVQNPVEEFQALRQLGFVYYLGGSIATAWVNLTQVPLMTAPYLAQFHGKAGVVRELLRAYKDALKMLTRKKGMDLFDPAKAPADMAQALQTAWDEGFFVPLNTWEVMGLAHNRTPALRGLSKATKTTVDAIGLMFSMAERLNRLVTFIATYRLARNPSVKANARRVLKNNALARSGELLNGFTPEKFAEWVIDETHFRMGKNNRPTILRGWGAWLGQFKGFTMQSLELFWRLAVQNGSEGRKALAMMMLMIGVTAGGWGLPFAEDITSGIELTYQKVTGIDKDIKASVRVSIAELTGSAGFARFVEHGLPYAMGVDLTRIGMGNIIPNTMTDAGGIPASLTIGRADQAFEHAKHGDVDLALAELLPNFVKNAVTGVHWGTQGVTSQTTGKTVIAPEDVSVGQMMLKGIGFTPAKIANKREELRSVARAEKAAAEKKAMVYLEIARLYADQERATMAGNAARANEIDGELQRAFEDVAAYNEGRSEHEQIILDKKQLRSKVAQELSGAEAKKGTPKAARSRRQQIEGAFGWDD